MRSTDVPEQSYDLRTREGFLARTAEVTDRRVPLMFRDATTDHPRMLAWCEAFAAGFPAQDGTPAGEALHRTRSLLLLGPTGVGKTHMTYAAIRRLAASGVSTRWEALTAADLYARLRPRAGIDSEAEFAQISGADLLLLDDLGAAKGSEWTEDVNYRLLNFRNDAGLATLVTSNLQREAPEGQPSLAVALGDRVMSRLLGMCDVIILRGTDRRRSS
jgi:DNA replication protein DnaC